MRILTYLDLYHCLNTNSSTFDYEEGESCCDYDDFWEDGLLSIDFSLRKLRRFLSSSLSPSLL